MKNVTFVVVSSHGKIMDSFNTMAEAKADALRLNIESRNNISFWADEYPADALKEYYRAQRPVFSGYAPSEGV